MVTSCRKEGTNHTKQVHTPTCRNVWNTLSQHQPNRTACNIQPSSIPSQLHCLGGRKGRGGRVGEGNVQHTGPWGGGRKNKPTNTTRRQQITTTRAKGTTRPTMLHVLSILSHCSRGGVGCGCGVNHRCVCVWGHHGNHHACVWGKGVGAALQHQWNGGEGGMEGEGGRGKGVTKVWGRHKQGVNAGYVCHLLLFTTTEHNLLNNMSPPHNSRWFTIHV